MWHMCISDALVKIYLWCSCYKCKTCISLYISLMQLIHMCSCHSASEWQEHTEMYLCISLMQLIYIWHIYISDVYLWCISPVHHTSFRRGHFSTNLRHFSTNLRHFSTNLRHFSTNLKHFSTNLKHFSTNLRHFSTNLRHFSTNLRHFSTNLRHFSTNLSPFGKIRQVQNTTSWHNSGMMKLNSIRISMVCGHAPYTNPPRNTMPKSLGTNSNPLRIFWSDTSFSPTGTA